MYQDVQDFDSRLGLLFPFGAGVLAEIWDQKAIVNILTDLLNSGVQLFATFTSGKTVKKASQMSISDTSVSLSDKKTHFSFQTGCPEKLMIARFPNHPLHNFVRVCCGAPAKGRNGNPVSDDSQESGEGVCSFVIYPAGSLLSDQRLDTRVADLAENGSQSTLFSEFMAVDEGDSREAKKVELIDYVQDDYKLWDQWLSKMDTNMFQTNVRPKNFTNTSGRHDDYYLKIIKYGNKKVGAVWLEKITPRKGTAELGLLIGEPHMWGLGIGSKAMSAMIEIAKSLGVKFLWVSVREANPRAVNCYKRGGFTIVRRIPVFTKADGSYQMWFHMEKMI